MSLSLPPTVSAKPVSVPGTGTKPSAETVATHPRFAGFSAEDRQRVQRIIDRGEWIASGTTHRLFWLEDAGKPWLTVLKRTKAGEIYLQSYRRASRRKIRKLRKGT